MNDILILTASAGAGALFGFAAAGIRYQCLLDSARIWARREEHARRTYGDRIDRALDQVTPGANATVKRMARMLRGEQ